MGELPQLTHDDIVQRALQYCDWAVARGLLAIRSHVDTSDPSLLPVQALLDVKQRVAPLPGLATGGLSARRRAAPPGRTRQPETGAGHGRGRGGRHSALRNAPWHEGAESVKILCELAAKLAKRVDMHCDECDDPHSRHVETLAFETQRLGLHGRVTGSHLTSMHSMDNYYVSKLIPLMCEADLGVVANPLINITLQGRHDTYPKRRGMTRVPELMAAGLTVALATTACSTLVQRRQRRHAGGRAHGPACGPDDQPGGHAPVL